MEYFSKLEYGIKTIVRVVCPESRSDMCNSLFEIEGYALIKSTLLMCSSYV